MRILILSPCADLIEAAIHKTGCETITAKEDTEVSDWPESDWVVSFGYRKLIPSHIIEKYKDRIINIHGSLLPWNRGAHPNFWSWWYNTPKGVSIHRVAPAIDGGTVLARQIVGDFDFRFGPVTSSAMTLNTTYNDLLIAAAGLFRRHWNSILNESIHPPTFFEDHPGSYHGAKDIDPFFPFLKRGWDTSVSEIRDLGDLYRGINGKA